MIKRLLGAMTTAFVYTCVATLLSQIILLAYVAKAWNIDRPRLIRMLAAAQGIQLDGPHGDAAKKGPAGALEQPSFDQILEARSLKARNLELRERALRTGIDQLFVDQSKLTADRTAMDRKQEAFEAELAEIQKKQKATLEAGWDENRRTLAAAKPKQAKELILKMLEKNEMNDVVALLSPMPDNRRAKIIAEFKSEEEIKKIDEILRLIRRGEPFASTNTPGATPVAPGPQGMP